MKSCSCLRKRNTTLNDRLLKKVNRLTVNQTPDSTGKGCRATLKTSIVVPDPDPSQILPNTNVRKTKTFHHNDTLRESQDREAVNGRLTRTI